MSEDYLVKLFDVDVTLGTMELGHLLSLQGTNKMGNYETYYEFKPTILEHYVQ